VPGLPGLELLEAIGRGGSSTVHRGWQDPPGREVAVKVLRPGSATDDARRLVHEGALEGRLDHRSIARVFDVRETRGRVYLVRELVQGETLAALVARSPLAPELAARHGAELALALAHAHARGVVHRDVKPENVVVEATTGRPKLLDFGFARDVRGELTRLTRTGESFGSVSYVAPEQVDDASRAGPPADVYGAGAVLYFALSGKPPFADAPFDRYLERLRRGEVTPLEKVAPMTPPALRALVERAMSPRPEERPTARSLARGLRDAAGRA
jgi:serine/threonine-protein kinase